MEPKLELSNYRITKAETCLNTAKHDFKIGDFEAAANRAYYCVFHSIRSLLALREVDFKKHSAVISFFRNNYIRTQIFDVTLSAILSKLFQIRNDSDYIDFVVISKKEVEEQIDNAEYFLNQIKAYLEKQNG